MAPIKDIRPNLYVFVKANQSAKPPQHTKTTIAYIDTLLVKSPIKLKNGSNKAVNPNNAKAKLVLVCLINR